MISISWHNTGNFKFEDKITHRWFVIGGGNSNSIGFPLFCIFVRNRVSVTVIVAITIDGIYSITGFLMPIKPVMFSIHLQSAVSYLKVYCHLSGFPAIFLLIIVVRKLVWPRNTWIVPITERRCLCGKLDNSLISAPKWNSRY